ncbi:glycoside hydrolase family 9 protein [Gaoshiqia sp. Z1-71]|uniref:glycoside hydrolase family 9 protein n=1 Tax=Gaoshiqia hydrogeniformans TaxID=3290090 RepID=UPI003BF899EE
MICRALMLFILFCPYHLFASGVIRVNQLGYFPDAQKVAVFLSSERVPAGHFQLVNCLSGEKVFEALSEKSDASVWGMQTAYRLDFSSFSESGGFYLQLGDAVSPSFRIAWDVYEGTADFPLHYMRQQRCGFNPFLNDSCHLHDGIIVDHPTRSGERIDVTGGWHDASDYLQYVTTSANAVYQMLFAWERNAEVFGDQFQANGLPGSNGLPDILDEARWGLEWLLKMNPGKNEMYNQIADDRDHRGYRLPVGDTVTYGLGKARPVYFVSGKPQGLGKHKNRSTGVASTAAKYASAFALGARLFRSVDPEFSQKMAIKARDAWAFALSGPGVCQTACVVSPYFYEEDNYVDDMQLAAASLFLENGGKPFEQQAKYWGELEPVTPWMELQRARHYQYYPFINLGHVWLAQSEDSLIAKQFAAFMKQGLENIRRAAAGDPFRIGIPFQWCSNNLVVAAATQARLYRQITGDESYLEEESALTDWLLGCNPWGTSMICGLPSGGDYPERPHSAITYLLHQTTTGGLVDGPVYKNIYENLRGIHLFEEDEYAAFQSGKAVYHDDMGDYSSNEPTMDGTASLTYLFSSLEKEGRGATARQHVVKDSQGAIVRMNPSANKVYLIFSAHDLNEGAPFIRKSLKKNRVKASFFFTGKFYADPENQLLVKQLIDDGHFLGAHSDGHLLYADWNKRDSLLVGREQFEADLQANYQKMAEQGIDIRAVRSFLPPYEWYNKTVVNWAHQLGLTVINFTPGIRTNADYTTPDMPNYQSSDAIFSSLEKFEKHDPHGLNGCLILIHAGTHPARTDKFYHRLNELISYLKKKGYQPDCLAE